MFPAVLFDYNGVLVDDEHVHLAAFHDVLSELGVEFPDSAYWQRYIGYDDAGAFRAILEDAGRTPGDSEIAALIEAKRPRYRARAEVNLSFFDGAAALLASCAARGPVIVVSGALREEIELGLQRLGVRDRVTSIVAAEDTRRGKPDPEGYSLGIAELARHLGERAASQSVAIEDSLAGIRAAKGAGLACVAVEHSTPGDELRAAGADLVVDHIRALDLEALDALALRLGR